MSPKDIESLLSQGFKLCRVEKATKRPVDKSWPKSNYCEPKDFEGYNAGVVCGNPLPGGGYLFVVDIDPRNGGFEAWKYLCQELDIPEVSETYTVTTGSGGWHIYFRTNKLLRKCKLAIGVDGVGEGGQVVASGSLHTSGNLYSLRSNLPIDAMPPALEAFIIKNQTPFFDGKTGHFSEEDTVITGQRNDWLTQHAGKMRRMGLSQQAINAALQEINAERCKPPLSKREVTRIAVSVSKYHPDDPVMTSPVPKLPEAKDQWAETFNQMFLSANGLVRDVAEDVLMSTRRPYPQVAVAASVAILGTVFQGTCRLRGGGGLNMYHWVVAPSAGGKDAYRRAVTDYLRQVDERLVFSDFGSAYGLRASLFASNSGISVIDEFQDELRKMVGKNAPGYFAQIVTDMKKLTSPGSKLEVKTLAKSYYPAIYHPQYSVFALGTVSGFRSLLSTDLIGDGMLSRFTIWPVTRVTEIDDPPMWAPDAETIQQLTKKLGMELHAQDQNYISEIIKFNSVSKDFNVKHNPQFLPKQYIGPDDNAKELFAEFRDVQEKAYLLTTRQSLDSNDMSPGSIIARSPELALKFAAIHGLGCIRNVITGQDMEWGILVAKALSDWLISEIKGQAGDTAFERLCSRILDTLSDGIKTKTEIFHALSRNVPSRLMNEALVSLCDAGKIVAKMGEGDILTDGASLEKMLKSKGIRFCLTSRL